MYETPVNSMDVLSKIQALERLINDDLSSITEECEVMKRALQIGKDIRELSINKENVNTTNVVDERIASFQKLIQIELKKQKELLAEKKNIEKMLHIPDKLLIYKYLTSIMIVEEDNSLIGLMYNKTKNTTELIDIPLDDGNVREKLWQQISSFYCNSRQYKFNFR